MGCPLNMRVLLWYSRTAPLHRPFPLSRVKQSRVCWKLLQYSPNKIKTYLKNDVLKHFLFLFLGHACTCMCICVSAPKGLHVHSLAWLAGQLQVSVLRCLPFEVGTLHGLELHHVHKLAGLLRDPPVSTFRPGSDRRVPPHLALYMTTGDPPPGPQAWEAGTLLLSK